jgi:eukaryotic-like serine/threonine-protein kinase
VPDESELDTQPLGTAPSAGGSWLIGGRYRVLDRLGSGGTAEVFRAHDEVLQREVAVKVFRTLVVDDPDGHGAQRRELELQSLARLSHPNLTTLYDGSVASEGPSYLVLELVRGTDLAGRLREGPLPEPEARQIGAQIADALAYAHARGMVHRDVKPANILVGTEDGDGQLRARLSDFGTVRFVDAAAMTADGLTLGTASYLAPEQVLGADVGPEADVYALGLVLIEALTGARCFEGPQEEVLGIRLTSSPEIPDELPDPWPLLLAAMTATEPDARPTAAEVAESLRTGGAPVVPAAPPRTAEIAAHRRGWQVWLALAGLAVAGLLAGIAYLASGGSAPAPADKPPADPTKTTKPAATHTHRSTPSLAAVVPSGGGHPARTSHPHTRQASAAARPSSTQATATATATASSSPAATSSSPAASSSVTSPTTPAPTPSPTSPPTSPGGTPAG